MQWTTHSVTITTDPHCEKINNSGKETTTHTQARTSLGAHFLQSKRVLLVILENCARMDRKIMLALYKSYRCKRARYIRPRKFNVEGGTTVFVGP